MFTITSTMQMWIVGWINYMDRPIDCLYIRSFVDGDRFSLRCGLYPFGFFLCRHFSSDVGIQVPNYLVVCEAGPWRRETPPRLFLRLSTHKLAYRPGLLTLWLMPWPVLLFLLSLFTVFLVCTYYKLVEVKPVPIFVFAIFQAV